MSMLQISSTRKISKEMRDKADRARELIRKYREQGEDFMLTAIVYYMGKEDTGRISFEEWFTEEKKAEMIEITTHVNEYDVLSGQLNDILRDVPETEEEEDPEAEAMNQWMAQSVNEHFDLSMECECKDLLEIFQETGKFETCPRCGEDMDCRTYSTQAEVCICPLCRADEELRMERHRRDSLKDWHFIRLLQEMIEKGA